jgi:hypothetical protein
MENSLDNFVNALNDFKNFDFDVNKIIKEYNNVDSLVTQAEKIQLQVEYKEALKRNLEAEIATLYERHDQYNQTIKTYEELCNLGCGLKELKKLLNLINESALANDINRNDSVKKFFKDLEAQYDNKLGFEKVVDELKKEKKKLEEQVPEYEYYLKLRGIVAPTLIHLHNSGVTDQDIIDMNHLVLEFKNSDFLSDPLVQNRTNNRNNNNQIEDKNSYWSLFTSKLQGLKNITSEINKRISEVDLLNQKITELERKKDQIESAYLNASSNLNILVSKTYESLEIAKIINEKIIPKHIIFLIFMSFDHSNSKDINNKKDGL